MARHSNKELAGVAYTCPKHPARGVQNDYCPSCMDDYHRRIPAAEMTPTSRVAAMRAFGEILTLPFDLFHKWVQELVGRPVFTHEMGSFGWEELIAEIESGTPADAGDALGKLAWDKPVLIVNVDTGEVDGVV